MNQQLTLAIQLNQQSTLDDFNWDTNPLLLPILTEMLAFRGERILFLWGAQGSGKTHLLQASCQALGREYSSMYLPLDLLKDWGAETLDDLSEQDLICIDDVDAIAKNPEWEKAVFSLFNQIKDNETSLLIVASQYAPTNLPIMLPDLRSRLAWGLTLQVHELNDEGKINTLILKAKKRGIDLSEVVAQYLIHHFSRHMHDMIAILDELDKTSLAQKRKITIPFVKEVLTLHLAK